MADAVGWAAQGAAALAAAHAAGIVHRDLKPANLMLTTGGEIKILDFGIARYMAASDKSSKVMGTLAYMAPERFDEQSGDARSDLYAFGCVLHELLTGSTPFEATGPVAMMTAHLNKAPAAPGTLRADVPAALDALILSLLAKSPRTARPPPPRSTTPCAPCTSRPRRPSHPSPRRGRPARGTPAGFGPSPDPLHSLATETAAAPPPGPPRPIATAKAEDPVATKEEDSKPPQHPSRRQALWLGLGAAAVVAAGTTAALLSRDGNHGTPSAGPGSNTGAPSGGKPSPGPRGWRFEAKTVLPTPPVLSSGTLRFTDGYTIYGLDALTGTEQAQVKFTREVGELTVADGMLYFGDSDGTLHARSGSERWTFAAGDYIPGRPAVARERVFFGSKDGKVYCLDTNSGREVWNFPTGDKVFCAPTVAEGTVYIGVAGTEPGLYALDAVNGARRWAFREGGQYFKTAAVADGLVFATANDDSLYAVDAATGTKKWSVSLKRGADTDSWFRPSPPVVASGTVFVGGGDKSLHALDAKTGTKKWTYDINGPFIPSTPTVADGRVYVADLEDMYGTVYALDATDGFQKWTVRTGAKVHAQNRWNAPSSPTAWSTSRTKTA